MLHLSCCVIVEAFAQVVARLSTHSDSARDQIVQEKGKGHWSHTGLMQPLEACPVCSDIFCP